MLVNSQVLGLAARHPYGGEGSSLSVKASDSDSASGKACSAGGFDEGYRPAVEGSAYERHRWPWISACSRGSFVYRSDASYLSGQARVYRSPCSSA
ncbi:hypothetical protein GOP47_0002129 [Adiantum capillus-veneris]|uniref:Uncharacterized protein n=1 Tax=Adiantum capillus-veneris TaxID=13818 RepID=A0A9D4VAY5_ADICA|nr:hypothetical protein GOP47_0002129 [Adiantum capillus-veneris]